jgi:hypothetical protein
MEDRDCEPTFNEKGEEVEITAIFRGTYFEVRLTKCPLHYITPEVNRVLFLHGLWPDQMPVGGTPLDQPSWLMEAFAIVSECRKELGEDD